MQSGIKQTRDHILWWFQHVWVITQPFSAVSESILISLPPKSPPYSINKEFFLLAVLFGSKVLDSDDNQDLLLYKETY